ncbi:pilus assembly protein CpaE [Homoserinibacter sp. YIM 151385]|uniref:pilus assembly protein CpaE n=1 Tax=Homoserinibacter sp. YIM 151385 TaxID=2985506 RepID=UPI0022F0D85F|nr:pilus assembly protein CpaE [Homoserinibacter sp. YIM 151385]WBU37945.1 pilus assembly protein CpaE [Homoserinibacter sp. YIM 151385]
MISTVLARSLREAGLRWTPASGDAFQIAGPDFEGDVFTVSDMTIEPQRHPTGTVLGFNGTTEWALDSVSLEDALWLPREDQLRDALGGTFAALRREPLGAGARYTVEVHRGGATGAYSAEDPAEAYGLALLALIRAAG